MRVEKHLKFRPKKTYYPKVLQSSLRKKAIKKIIMRLLPNIGIVKIILIGSSVKNTFGEYKSPGFRGSLYSDFDFIVFVKDDYKIPKWLIRQPTAKPFLDNGLNLAYRNKRFVDRKYDVEVFFIRERNMNNREFQKLAEKAGISMSKKSRHKHLVVYGVES